MSHSPSSSWRVSRRRLQRAQALRASSRLNPLLLFLGTLVALGGLTLPALSSAEESLRESATESPLLETESGSGTEGPNFEYYGLFFGPSPGRWSSFQTRPDGTLNLERPVLLKNWASLSVPLFQDWELSGAFYWIWVPVQGQELWLRDPYVRLAKPQVLSPESPVQAYVDFRWHPGVSGFSRDRDQLFGLQLFSMVSYQSPVSELSLGVLGSARKNFFGPEPEGSSWEFYLAPQIRWSFSDRLSLQLLYELSALVDAQDPTSTVVSDGTDLEPSLLWQVSKNLTLNPFLTVYVGEGFRPENTAIGMGISWALQ
jgi:hypothetical protein